MILPCVMVGALAVLDALPGGTLYGFTDSWRWCSRSPPQGTDIGDPGSLHRQADGWRPTASQPWFRGDSCRTGHGHEEGRHLAVPTFSIPSCGAPAMAGTRRERSVSVFTIGQLYETTVESHIRSHSNGRREGGCRWTGYLVLGTVLLSSNFTGVLTCYRLPVDRQYGPYLLRQERPGG